MGQGIGTRGARGWAAMLAAAAITLSGCQSATPPPSPSSSSGGPPARAHQPLLGLTRQQEIEVGHQGAAALAQQEGLVAAPQLDQQLTQIADRLATHTAEPTYRYQVHILSSGEVNAMSLPDGTVFVTRGFVAQLHPTAEDYEAVLGHEISHVAQHHLSRRVATQREAGIALTLFALLSHRQRMVVAANVLGSLAQLQFSRGQEYDADIKGTDALAAAGYDPEAMVHLLEKLERLHPSPSRLQIGLSNHPATRDRIAHVQQHIAAMHRQS